ncbi:ComEA family DNA-binding protein [Luteimonas sp. YGD11-2]|uniref:ComEA family DNA-binding protein n=1 Tax=Alterluteimonas muca TaxID=2878684 RepID=UPI00100BC2E9
MNMFTRTLCTSLLSLLLAGAAWASEKVNINTADAATLDRVLVNVGPAKAEAIVEHRKANGAFRSVEQLALVKGIGLRTVELNRDRIELGAAPARRPAERPAAAATTATATARPQR